MHEDLRNILYLVAAMLFIFGIKGLTHPRTAVRGNLMGAVGMFIAIVVTLIDTEIVGWGYIAAGVLLGGGIGAWLAKTIEMTKMPELVALFNGFGGIASLFVAGAEVHSWYAGDLESTFMPPMAVRVAVAAAGIIGAVTFSGSVLAFAKLAELISGNPVTNPLLKIANAFTSLGAVIFAILLCMSPDAAWLYWAIVACAFLTGIFLVQPIGGADMPVVISLLNSYSGLAAAATGFVINNNVLIIAGSLVGASGLILTRIMCVAMNRSLFNVMFGVMAEAGSIADADEVYAGKVKSTSPDEVAMLFDTARYVVVVPGYGMAVAQAQHIVRELADQLEERGCKVEYGIHPVAGRMPGHMNVLLAEADVPYDQLIEMDDINRSMSQVDIAMVIGANDTVNPAGRDDPSSPIAGMPIINVDEARTVVVVKRSLSPGFAGIPNPLFAADNTLMMFGDGKKALTELVGALKEL